MGDSDVECSTVDFFKHMPGCLELEQETTDEISGKVFWYPNRGGPFEETIKSIFLQYASGFISYYQPALVQFWGASENDEGISTSDQPFVVYKLCNGVCRYRFKCMTITRESQREIPTVVRAFAERRIQYCPDIRLYETRQYSCPDTNLPTFETHEFPLKGFAEWSDLRGYLAIPLLQPESDHRCIGVIEFLFRRYGQPHLETVIVLAEVCFLFIYTTLLLPLITCSLIYLVFTPYFFLL